jgi:DNA-directed RNA polymerase
MSHVPIGYDATCSGLQLLGSFVRDPETCRLVNVTPSETPQDAYGEVARKARDILSDPDRWRMLAKREDDESHDIPINMVDRSVAKKVVMLIPYGGSYDTLVNHVRIATKDWGLKIRDSHTLTKALIQGMDEAVPGFFALNKWFKDVAAAILASGKREIVWATPTGSIIHQVYMKPVLKPINTVALGISNYKDPDHHHSKKNLVVDESKEGELNKRKNQTALAANWTHSMDAAVLQEAFHDFELPFSTVHDCLYAPAGAIPEANRRIREAFVKVTSSDMLQAFLDMNGIDFPLPPIGTVDLTTALESMYLFS